MTSETIELFPYPVFTPETEIADVCSGLLEALFDKMRFHEPGTRVGEDIEELHDMRVSVRRQRVAVRVFKRCYLDESRSDLKQINAGLRVVGRSLGPVRDLDILIDKFRLYLEELPAGRQADFSRLYKLWNFYRDEAQSTMVDFLESDYYHDLIDRYKSFLIAPQHAEKISLGVELTSLVDKRLNAVFNHEYAVANKDIHQLHQLRIAFKRLRYVVEFFESVLGPGYETLILQLKQIQDHLGDLNDAAFAVRYMSTLLGEWNMVASRIPVIEPGHNELVKAYLEIRLQERQLLLDTFPERWTAFLQSGFVDKLKQAAAL